MWMLSVDAEIEQELSVFIPSVFGLLGMLYGEVLIIYYSVFSEGFFFAVKEVSLLEQGSQGRQSIYQLEQVWLNLLIIRVCTSKMAIGLSLAGNVTVFQCDVLYLFFFLNWVLFFLSFRKLSC